MVVRGSSAVGTPKRDVVVIARASGASVNTGKGNDLICGSGGPDLIRTGAGTDTVYAEAGDDLLDGGPGRDRLLGGQGFDSFRTTRGDRTDATAGDRLNGKRRKLDAALRPGVRQLPPSAVSSIDTTADGRQTVQLRASSPAPSQGSVLVVNATATSGGALGRVASSRETVAGGLEVVLTPVPLSDAYSRLRVDFRDSSTARSAGFSGMEDGRFRCQKTVGLVRDVRIDLSKFSLDGYLDADPRSPYLSLDFKARPTIGLSAELSAGTTCVSKLKKFSRNIPSTPLFVSFQPIITIRADGKLKLSYDWTPFIAYGFSVGRNQDRNDRTYRNSGKLDIAGTANASAALDVNVGLSVAERLGITGTVTPHIDGALKVVLAPPPAQACARVTAAADWKLVGYADAFVRNWKWQIAQGTFFKNTLLDRCFLARGDLATPDSTGVGGPAQPTGPTGTNGPDVGPPPGGTPPDPPGDAPPDADDGKVRLSGVSTGPAGLFIPAETDPCPGVFYVSMPGLTYRTVTPTLYGISTLIYGAHPPVGAIAVSMSCRQSTVDSPEVWRAEKTITITAPPQTVSLFSDTVTRGGQLLLTSALSQGPTPCPLIDGQSAVDIDSHLGRPGLAFYSTFTLAANDPATVVAVPVPADAPQAFDYYAFQSCHYSSGNRVDYRPILVTVSD
jgi:hypothetical protein